MPALYLTIASQIRELIKNGSFSTHTRLTERAIAEYFCASRSTVTAAFSVLKEEGYLESHAKQYTRVKKRDHSTSLYWDRFARTGMNARSTAQIINTYKFITSKSKKNLTYGYYKDFKQEEPLLQAFASLARKRNIHDLFNCFHPQGLPELRDTVSVHLLRHGIHAGPGEIIIFNDYTEAVYTIAMALLNRGMNFFCAEDDMISVNSTIRSPGANIYRIAMDSEGPSVADFKKKLRKQYANMLYLNPVCSYPEGMTYSEARLDELLAVCEQENVAIIENDFLRDLWVTPPPPPIKSKNSDIAIYIGSLANCVNMGMRICWAVIPAPIIPRIIDVKLQMSNINNSGVELVINEMLAEGYYQSFLEDFRVMLRQRFEHTNRTYEKYLTGLAKWVPESNIYSMYLEFDGTINLDIVAAENPYFMVARKIRGGKLNCLYLYAINMSPDDFENMIMICAESVKKQMR